MELPAGENRDSLRRKLLGALWGPVVCITGEKEGRQPVSEEERGCVSVEYVGVGNDTEGEITGLLYYVHSYLFTACITEHA